MIRLLIPPVSHKSISTLVFYIRYVLIEKE
jgi:hypothetical protein